MNIADKYTLDIINDRANKIGNYIGYRHHTFAMKYYLPEGTKIACDRKEIEVLQVEGTPVLIDEGYEISRTGIVMIISTEGDIETVPYNIY